MHVSAIASGSEQISVQCDSPYLLSHLHTSFTVSFIPFSLRYGNHHVYLNNTYLCAELGRWLILRKSICSRHNWSQVFCTLRLRLHSVTHPLAISMEVPCTWVGQLDFALHSSQELRKENWRTTSLWHLHNVKDSVAFVRRERVNSPSNFLCRPVQLYQKIFTGMKKKTEISKITKAWILFEVIFK